MSTINNNVLVSQLNVMLMIFCESGVTFVNYLF